MTDPQVISDDGSEEVEEETRRIREHFIIDENEDEEEDNDNDEARHDKGSGARGDIGDKEALEEDY
ncbi:uncharacterized protein F5891DRAFT_1194405 [Suillus fuscotomentosus]|uniref:Uncharacterized protein n=1 Tax=Suillus fuscotomentosus TaxID=1912939 RepID=A0AAD4DX09_9AGAM|nr:uncharacterized protein F5891DRAFT_1194405 [Suillus fuscotomentosus]KAG1895202.1 hypothetical protein F5891DRAFT_1194405 [Suillus fuscotomentosus]